MCRESASLDLEDMNLSEWYALTHSFALLVPLTDVDAITRYLGRLEKGIPIHDKGSTRLGNVCKVHWAKIPDSGIFF